MTGGRDYADRSRVFVTLDEMHAADPFALLIHGACVDRFKKLRGADRWAEEWALAREVPYIGVPAKWHSHAYAAGPVRNRDILADWNPGVVIAFPGGTGTADMVRKAEHAGVPVVRVPDEVSA